MTSADNDNEQKLRSLRVLVVEDESLVAMFIEDVLADLGHQMVGPISHIDMALPAAQSEQFDVAILDVNLNGQAIYPVADAIAERGIPFVFSTGYGRKGLPEAYQRRPTLDKPFLPEDIRRVLHETCGGIGTD